MSELLESRQLLAADFDWRMVDRLQTYDGDRLIVPNTVDYVQADKFGVILDVTGFELPDFTRPTDFAFKIDGVQTDQVQPVLGGPKINGIPQEYVVDLPEGTFQISVIGSNGSVTDEATLPVVVDDILIVAIGDSYGSGEGAVERTRGTSEFGEWMQSASPGTFSAPIGFPRDEPLSGLERTNFEHRIAHRSSYAASAQAALELERSDPKTSVTFVFLAASGGEISEGALQEYKGITDEVREDDKSYSNTGFGVVPVIAPEPLKPQLQQLKELVGNRPIDTLTISFGGNDVGFANVIAGALFLDRDDPMQSDDRYDQLRNQLKAAVEQGQVEGSNHQPWNDFLGAMFSEERFNEKISQVRALLGLVSFVYDDLLSWLARDFFPIDRTTIGLNHLLESGELVSGEQRLGFDELNSAINDLPAGRPQQILITHYPDPFSNWVNGTLKLNDSVLNDLFQESGIVGDILEGLFNGPLEVTAEEMKWARETVIVPLNAKITDAAQKFSWTVVDGVGEAWKGHGFAEVDEQGRSQPWSANASLSPDSPGGKLAQVQLPDTVSPTFIVTPTESAAWQGPADASQSKGQVHPNKLGSAATGALIYEAIAAHRTLAYFTESSNNEYVVGVKTGDVLPVDLKKWLNIDSSKNSQFFDLSFEVLGAESASAHPLVSGRLKGYQRKAPQRVPIWFIDRTSL